MIKKRINSSKNEEKSLILFSSFLLKDLFYKNLFLIYYILGNKIMAIILANTCATRYGFIDENFTKKVCQFLEIKPQCLIKPKLI